MHESSHEQKSAMSVGEVAGNVLRLKVGTLRNSFFSFIFDLELVGRWEEPSVCIRMRSV